MVCINCGKCCDYILDSEIKTCKYLRYRNHNSTFCTIYENRIGTIIDSKIIDNNSVKQIICVYRKEQKKYIPGCTEMNDKLNPKNPKNPKILVGISVINSVHPTFLKALEDSRHEWKMKKYFVEVLWDDHVPLDYSRNIIVKNALHAKADYILFLDSDIKLPVGTLDKLIGWDKDIITGIYYWKNPYIPVISKYDSDMIGYNPIINFDKLDNPVEIDATGFGCCLVKTDVFKIIPYPWFKNEWIYPQNGNKNGNINNKEPHVLEGDLNFCKLVQDYQYQIYADNTIICPHGGNGVYITKAIVDNSKLHLGGSLKYGEQPVELIKYLVEKYKPKSVLDVGCGSCGAIKIFDSFEGIDKIDRICGLDGDRSILFRKDIPQRYLDNLTIQDLEISSYKYPEKFDMVFSYETAEHISNGIGRNNYIDTLTENCNNILVMTHGVPGQEGYHHVNNQNDKYWIDLITRKGFEYLEEDTQYARNNLKDDKYFKQSGLIFKHT